MRCSAVPAGAQLIDGVSRSISANTAFFTAPRATSLNLPSHGSGHSPIVRERAIHAVGTNDTGLSVGGRSGVRRNAKYFANGA
jgi:hypothetical protein